HSCISPGSSTLYYRPSGPALCSPYRTRGWPPTAPSTTTVTPSSSLLNGLVAAGPSHRTAVLLPTGRQPPSPSGGGGPNAHLLSTAYHHPPAWVTTPVFGSIESTLTAISDIPVTWLGSAPRFHPTQLTYGPSANYHNHLLPPSSSSLASASASSALSPLPLPPTLVKPLGDSDIPNLASLNVTKMTPTDPTHVEVSPPTVGQLVPMTDSVKVASPPLHSDLLPLTTTATTTVTTTTTTAADTGPEELSQTIGPDLPISLPGSS
ncbi:hypothetical protein BJ085DRAFT_38228, partial [Dimargaris cristalligena]